MNDKEQIKVLRLALLGLLSNPQPDRANPSYTPGLDRQNHAWATKKAEKALAATVPAQSEASEGRDAARIDWLETLLKSDKVEVGVSLYCGSKTFDGVTKPLIWVGAIDSGPIMSDGGECLLGDDFGEGTTLRAAIDAAIALQSTKGESDEQG